MKRTLLIAALALAAFGAEGCIVIHSEKEVPCKPVVVEPQDATIREIDAVGRLSFDQDRKRGYERIAGREALSESAQVYLIEAAFKRLAFEDARVDVLLTLVANPGFSSAAEAALLDRLDRLAFEQNKTRILDAINERKG
jgi:hypothetical protein